ncbi:hypothetical protein [Dictyobacter formicarum]|uniref:Tunicamycin resistance protein n=1 Tax=Dictyobacter formicarum TaxID=2778368 RepID=A0ABQ3VPJ4_9CHLR|nr:hypothetical protein [Dictyobacter formicarum]GHO87016.1 hypothetical protein KSZ_50220 [Dictyobacter formicarum]
MIILINGSFASGKTTTAELLVQRLYHSMLYDPEIVGAGLAAIVKPIEAFTDFQDLTAWRPLVIETARVLKQVYGRTLIIPMTLWHRPYFEEITDGLRQIDPHFYHFCLTARKETLLNGTITNDKFCLSRLRYLPKRSARKGFPHERQYASETIKIIDCPKVEVYEQTTMEHPSFHD